MKSSTVKSCVFHLSTLLLAIILTGTNAATADTVRVGIIAPFSGEFNRWGRQIQRGIEIYQALYGTKIGGNEIEVIYRDSGGLDPNRTKRLAEELIIREHVNFLGGFVFTPNAMSIASVISKAKVPAILFNAAASNITRASEYFVRTSYTVPQVTKPVAQWAGENGYSTVVSIVAEYSPGIDAEETFKRVFEENGGKVLETIRVPVATSDFTPFFERILAIKPDGVFMFGPGGPSSVAMVRTWAARLKNEGIGLLVTTETTELELPNFGLDAVGIIGSSFYTYDQGIKENQQLKEMFEKMFGLDSFPDPALIATFDGMHLIYQAVGELGQDITGDKVIDLIKGMIIESPRGNLLIDPETRDVVQDVHLQRVDSRDGRLVNTHLMTFPQVKDPWKEWNPE